ncbi:hypothetical protein [Tropicibacter sp. Alg240-R139]|uniref:hypothetical protein n=1 Tax=Tropicibacter sp. Alg240-R139 TaxID=2305991 RepID=UPI0013DF4D92|nr:hypothetical protein [Tropicibacter sp. Alg240-R139]
MYDSYPEVIAGLALVKILLTVVAFEFFRPIKLDLDETHLFNPDCVGHERFHLVWHLGVPREEVLCRDRDPLSDLGVMETKIVGS